MINTHDHRALNPNFQFGFEADTCVYFGRVLHCVLGEQVCGLEEGNKK